MLPLLIQDALEQRIAPLEQESLSLGGDPYGSDSRNRVQAQHWIAYQGSDFPTGQGTLPDPESRFSQERVLEYVHYVEVQDLRRDYRVALYLHERLMGAIAGFRPNVDGVMSQFRLVNDAVVSAKVEAEVVYRYKATYRIKCKWEATPLITEPPFVPTELRYGIWRSPIDMVGAPESVKDAEGVIEGVN